MESEDEDIHICLRCQTTIIGLDQYIKHRKENCFNKSDKININNEKENDPENECLPSLNANSTQEVKSVNFITSQNKSKTNQEERHETSVQTDPDITSVEVSSLPSSDNPAEQPNDFFSSLELQSKTGSITQRIGNDVQIDFSNFDTSDKDCNSGRQFGLGKSVHFDIDFELSPESNDHGFVSDESDDEIQPTLRHNGGKWKPGCRPPFGYTGGKWKPSLSPPPQININKENLNESVEAETQNEELNIIKTTDDEEEEYNCELCSKKLSSKYTFERHCNTSYHKKRLHSTTTRHLEISTSSNVTSDIFHCNPCNKKFTSKQHMARHLLTPIHTKCSQNHPDKFKLIVEFQNIITKQCLFQCTICAFYFNNYKEFLIHLESEAHHQKTIHLVGPIYCNICQCEYLKNEEVLMHLNSDKHKKEFIKGYRPCIIREKRYLIKCKVCGLSQHSAAQLKKHIEFKHPNANLSNIISIPPHLASKSSDSRTCPFCKIQFLSAFKLKLHIRKKHKSEKPYFCEPCKRSFSNKSTLLGHQLSKIHKKNTNDNKQLGKENSRAINQSLSCHYCERTFISSLKLNKHEQEVHKEKFFQSENSQLEFKNITQRSNLKLKFSSKSEKFVCDICDYSYTSESRFLFHKSLHLPPVFEPVKLNSKIKPSKNENPACEKNSKKKFICKISCPVCNKLYAKSSLQLHIYTHTGEKPFKCDKCDASFNQQATLNSHIKRHSGEKHFECSKCTYKCLKKSTLKRHLLTHIDRPRLFLCDVCGAGHFDQWLLKNHMKLHFSKEYKCPFDGCKLAFKAKSEVTYHMRVHTNERPYLCDKCAYAGKSQHALTKHKRSHTGERPFKCPYCSYAAALTSHLKRHLRLHTGAKPFKCPYCNYTCNTHENVRKHILSTKKHVGQKVYPCKFCDFATNESKDFRNHLEKDHNHILEDQDTDILSVIAGVYDKSHDPKFPVVPIPYTPKRDKVKEMRKGKKEKPFKKTKALKNVRKELSELESVVTETVNLQTTSEEIITSNTNNAEELLNASTIFVNDITTGEVVMTNEEIFSDVTVSQQEESVNVTTDPVVEIVNERRTVIMYIKVI